MAGSISIDILAIIALCFTIYLAKRNVVVNHYQNRIYILLSVITITLLLLEIATVLMASSGSSNLVVPHRIANILGFSLSPLFPYIFLFFNNTREKVKYHHYLAIPLYFNALICILSYQTGWVFFVNGQNQYSRGDFFLLPALAGMFYFVLLVAEVLKNSEEYDIDHKGVIIPFLLIPILGLILQILYSHILIIWGCIALYLVFFYMYLRELQYKYDVQTGIKNRAAFQKEMEKYLKSTKKAAIVILDINNLKLINDKYGHKKGDEVIVITAELISESFAGIGVVFRIGGDEFCIICEDVGEESIQSALADLEKRLAEYNEGQKIRIDLAYGYALTDIDEDKCINSAFERADQAMYEHKATLKREPFHFLSPHSSRLTN